MGDCGYCEVGIDTLDGRVLAEDRVALNASWLPGASGVGSVADIAGLSPVRQVECDIAGLA